MARGENRVNLAGLSRFAYRDCVVAGHPMVSRRRSAHLGFAFQHCVSVNLCVPGCTETHTRKVITTSVQ